MSLYKSVHDICIFVLLVDWVLGLTPVQHKYLNALSTRHAGIYFQMQVISLRLNSYLFYVRV